MFLTPCRIFVSCTVFCFPINLNRRQPLCPTDKHTVSVTRIRWTILKQEVCLCRAPSKHPPRRSPLPEIFLASKQRKRCCNPAAVFAREIAAVTRIPYRQDILHDNGTGKTQHTLSAAERHKNVEQFSVALVSLEGMRVLLCDDVLTTGSTMNRCAALLNAQGAAEVAAISMTTTAMESHSKEPTHG